LQENVIQRVGGEKDIKIDCRVIAATNKDLWKEIKEYRFREDLFHRLAIIVIHVPDLNQRMEDIPILADYFLNLICYDHGVPLKQFNSNALDAMKSIQWTGNIRELRNMIERLVILAGDKITLEDVKLYANVK
jgi:DNA-binding NtrC family response regulator